MSKHQNALLEFSRERISGFRVVLRPKRIRAAGERALDELPIIMVVDDDQIIQSFIEEALSEGGYQAAIASSGEEALRLINEGSGQYRAVVTDINFGPNKIDGWEVAKHARQIRPEFPVVYMSGDSAGDWASKGVPNSIMLTKPFAPAQLVTAVSQLLNSGPPTT